MVKSEVLKKYMNGRKSGLKMFEIIALCSLYLDDFTTEECNKIEDGLLFNIYYDENFKRYLSLNRFKKPKEEAEKHFYNLIESENKKRLKNGKELINYDKTKIKF